MKEIQMAFFLSSLDMEHTNWCCGSYTVTGTGSYWLHFAVRPKDNRRKTWFIQI